MLVGELDYSLTPASKVSTTEPCTNRPIECSVCAEVVWSYSLTKHFEQKHMGEEIPADMQAAMKLGTHEEEWMRLVVQNKRPKACLLATCACKKA